MRIRCGWSRVTWRSCQSRSRSERGFGMAGTTGTLRVCVNSTAAAPNQTCSGSYTLLLTWRRRAPLSQSQESVCAEFARARPASPARRRAIGRGVTGDYAAIRACVVTAACSCVVGPISRTSKDQREGSQISRAAELVTVADKRLGVGPALKRLGRPIPLRRQGGCRSLPPRVVRRGNHPAALPLRA